MEPKDKKTQEQVTENSNSNPQLAELQKTLQTLQEQNKLLVEQVNKDKAEKEQAKKAAEEAEKKKKQQELETDSDLESLLKQIGQESEDDDSKKKHNKVDNLSNEELLGVVSNAVEKFVDARLQLDREEREKSQDGFLKKVSNIEQMIGHMVAQQSVNEIRAKYPDFEQYRDDIAALIKETPGLSIDKAYKLAKAERLDKELALQHVETELPDIGPSGLPAIRRRDTERKDNNQGTAGLNSFRSFLSEGIARTVANRTKR